MAITAADLQVKLSTSGADKVKSDLAGIGRAVDDTGQRSSRMGGTIATAFRWGIIGAFTGAVIGGTAAIGDFIMGASNLSEAQSKVNVVYGKSANTINKWAKTTSRAFGITETAALDTAGTFGNLFTNMGFTTDTAADMSITVTELSADLSSFFNVSQPQVIDAMTSAFVGEYDALQRLGIPINAAAVEQFALNNGIWDGVDAMTEAERAQAVYGLVLENTTNAQGDFARTSGETANQMRILSASFSELGVRIGSVLLPAANALVGWMIDAVDYAGALGDAFSAGGFGAVIDQLAADLSNIIVPLPSVVVEVADWLVNAGGDLIGRIREKVIGMIMGGDSGGDGTGGATYGGITIEDAIKVQINDWALELLDTDHSGDITLDEVQQAVDNALEGIIGIDVEIQDAKLKIANPEGDLTLADVQGWVDTAIENIIGVDIEVQDGKLKISNPTNDLTLADVQGWVDDAMEGIVGVDIEIQDWNFGFGKINLDPAFEAIEKAIESVKSKWNALKSFDLGAPDINWPKAPDLSGIPFVTDLISLFGQIGDLFSNTEWSFSVGVPDIDWPNPMDLVPDEIENFVRDPWGFVKNHIGGGDGASQSGWGNVGAALAGEAINQTSNPYSALQEALRMLITYGQDAGSSLQQVSTAAGDIGGKFLEAASGSQQLGSSFGQLGPAAETASASVRAALNQIPPAVSAIGATAGLNALLAGIKIADNFGTGAGFADDRVRAALSGVAGAVRAAGATAALAALAAGINIGRALAAGILSQVGTVRAAAAALSAAATVTVSKQLQISSPSRVFMQLGEYVGEGFAIGIRSMVPDTAAASAALVSVPSVASYGAGAMATATTPAGGGETHIHVHVQQAYGIEDLTAQVFEVGLPRVFGEAQRRIVALGVPS